MLKRLILTLALIAQPSFALADDISSTANIVAAEDSGQRTFTKKRYTINGSAWIETSETDTQLVFSEDFSTKNGPDLRIYLSKSPISSLSSHEVDASALRLSVLKSHKGTQRYIIPKEIDLQNYQSVVIQCESYTVLWGGFDL